MTENRVNNSSMPDTADGIARVLAVRELAEAAYIIRIERGRMTFTPGQHITLGLHDDTQLREYSIYSRPQDPFLEVLIKEVDQGLLSTRLHRVKPGDQVRIDGPFGFFVLDDNAPGTRHLFVATGTGIAPFHSMAGAAPGLDYQLLHGVRHMAETYEREHYPDSRYVACTSRDRNGDFQGRVTDYLAAHPPDPGMQVYLCGNCEMIYEVYDQLSTGGFPVDQIRTEVYF